MDPGNTSPAVEVRPFLPPDQQQLAHLVLAIQREEFGIPITAEEQPDLLDVPGNYQRGDGNFWVAVDTGRIVGSIGLLDIGHSDGAIRKMFVAPSHRGRAGVAAALLAACLRWARARSLRRVLLGTTEQFRAAHRFYEKTGFTQVPPEDLPPHFPRMRLDTRFYAIALVGQEDAPAH